MFVFAFLSSGLLMLVSERESMLCLCICVCLCVHHNLWGFHFSLIIYLVRTNILATFYSRVKATLSFLYSSICLLQSLRLGLLRTHQPIAWPLFMLYICSFSIKGPVLEFFVVLKSHHFILIIDREYLELLIVNPLRVQIGWLFSIVSNELL